MLAFLFHSLSNPVNYALCLSISDLSFSSPRCSALLASGPCHFPVPYSRIQTTLFSSPLLLLWSHKCQLARLASAPLRVISTTSVLTNPLRIKQLVSRLFDQAISFASFLLLVNSSFLHSIRSLSSQGLFNYHVYAPRVGSVSCALYSSTSRLLGLLRPVPPHGQLCCFHFTPDPFLIVSRLQTSGQFLIISTPRLSSGSILLILF